ncbi:hypothetical protein N6L26_12200 [Qipengyuania sp. SS22]|uniref:hypothetical protein n=1 Tax=Qipengyuania sp. SS22 TaxID=2979461 RepID=UPI0021E5674D|nr:hypothetical protein [Qipengyuania sp. SS22]UYH54787.1 hypothetical protein N6L26_12200 [Qipengyuania sp. SS22]
MGSHALKAFILLCAGILFWLLASRVTGANTPWESDAYWYFWYPLCLALAGMAGFFLRDAGWIAGGILIFSQIPVMWLQNDLVAAGLFISCILAVHGIAISMLAGRIAVQIRVQ